MAAGSVAGWMQGQEARALLTRLARVKPFALHETMVPAAAPAPATQVAVEQCLARGRRVLHDQVHRYLRWLQGPEGRRASPAEMQRRFTFLRLRFNSVLSQFDLFADVITQRSEHETGVWLSGLDVVAADALRLPGGYFEIPPVLCYLDRGHGAAIRRARTRLPGGGENPVAIIRVPRERMVGSGIASSLVHEVGHQGVALLGLVDSIRLLLQGLQKGSGEDRIAWQLWERWISEILADFWSVAKVGVASTLGLIGVVSLPRPFVFRVSLDDPHPMPWIRVKLSCVMGQALYPHTQWERLARLWESFYPTTGLDEETRRLIATLEEGMPGFVGLLVHHRPKALRGRSLMEVMSVTERQPDRLTAYYQAWRASPARIQAASPSLAFAVIGQARANGEISPEEESRTIAQLLTHWALRSTLDTSAICAGRSKMPVTTAYTN
ncbi:MAG: hypothetical protein HYY11_06830 [Candidatus Methylomirabilis oxyfera]|nr:hypothetical protein [Candidatus Methylomirabilis oxyfera]